MSDEIETSSDKKPKSGKLKKSLLGIVAALVMIGGGAAGGYWAAGSLNAKSGEPEDSDRPKLVSKDGDTVDEPKPEKSDLQKLEFDQSKYKATYYPIEAPFTSNLKNSDGFAQLSLAVSTYYDERVMENIREHETAIRSAVLMTMAEQSAEQLATQSGKETLQGLLTTAINVVLKEKSGFGGVDNVYFTNFVVQ